MEKQLTVPRNLFANPGSNNKVERIRLSYAFTLASTGANTFNTVIGNTNVAAGPDWAGLAASYAEYRIMKINLHFIPYYTVTVSGIASETVNVGIFFVYDNNSTTALSTYNKAASYDNVQFVDLIGKSRRLRDFDLPFTKDSPIPWTSINSTQAGGILMFGSGAASASTNYATCIVSYYTEFRGRE